MKLLKKVESIQNATDRELLLMILSAQIQTLREINSLRLAAKDIAPHKIEDISDDIVDKFDVFLGQIDNAIKRRNEN